MALEDFFAIVIAVSIIARFFVWLQRRKKGFLFSAYPTSGAARVTANILVVLCGAAAVFALLHLIPSVWFIAALTAQVFALSVYSIWFMLQKHP